MSTAQWSVALSREQDTQARAFHHWVRAHHPRLLSSMDVARGNVRATLMAHARRASYWVLKKRMG
jgi:hypothetical protein